MRTRDPDFRNRCLIYAGLALVTVAAYWPVLHHEFVNYDDQQYVTDNSRVQAGLTWAGFKWAFGFYAGNWHPLAWLSHMLDCQLYQARAGGHHLTNLLLHVASTLLLFNILRRATKTLWQSAAVAALFAWHPLHVESVAWVAERKDVLCGLFWMLTLWAYVRYAATRQQPVADGISGSLPVKPMVSFLQSPYYWLTLVLFALALMAKPMAVTLPLVLLLLDFWPLGRFSSPARTTATFRLVAEKIPFLLLAGVDCVLTLRAQQIAIVSTAGLTVPQRLAHAAVAYCHYLGTTFVPVDLAVYYPYQIHLSDLVVAGAAILLGVITATAFVYCRRRPWLIVGWLWFLGTLVPVIGLVQVGDQAWADRYTYLPLIGVFLMVAWTVGEVIRNRCILTAVAAVAAIALVTLTWRQVACWKDTRTLFEHADKVTTHNYLAITMLGSILATEHKYDEAIIYYQRALSYEPTFPEAHFFMGAALDEQGKYDEALAEYQQALWFKPTQEQTHIFMGIALAREKRYDDAVAHYLTALKLNPDSAVTHNNLARIYHTEGRIDDAIVHYHAALELNPKLALAHNNLGILLLQKGDAAGGVLQLRQALQLNATNTETQFNLALALNEQQQWPEAANWFAKTASEHANDATAHYQYAVALAHLHQTHQALSEFAAALLIQPDFPNALDGLAWILSTEPQAQFRNGAQAVNLAEHACDLTAHSDPAKLKSLAAAYAEAGRFGEATNAIEIAIRLANARQNAGLAAECSAMQQQLLRNQPWRE